MVFRKCKLLNLPLLWFLQDDVLGYFLTCQWCFVVVEQTAVSSSVLKDTIAILIGRIILLPIATLNTIVETMECTVITLSDLLRILLESSDWRKWVRSVDLVWEMNISTVDSIAALIIISEMLVMPWKIETKVKKNLKPWSEFTFDRRRLNGVESYSWGSCFLYRYWWDDLSSGRIGSDLQEGRISWGSLW